MGTKREPVATRTTNYFRAPPGISGGELLFCWGTRAARLQRVEEFVMGTPRMQGGRIRQTGAWRANPILLGGARARMRQHVAGDTHCRHWHLARARLHTQVTQVSCGSTPFSTPTLCVFRTPPVPLSLCPSCALSVKSRKFFNFACFDATLN